MSQAYAHPYEILENYPKRRREDSNLRNPFGLNTLAVCCIRPLCHASNTQLPYTKIAFYTIGMNKIRVENHTLGGGAWFAAWLFTIGYLKLTFWQGVLAVIIWPYYLGHYFTVIQ